MNGGRITFFISVAIHGLVLSIPAPLHKTLPGSAGEARAIPVRILKKKSVHSLEKPKVRAAIQHPPEPIEKPQQTAPLPLKQVVQRSKVIPKRLPKKEPLPIVPSIAPPVLTPSLAPSEARTKAPPAELEMKRVGQEKRSTPVMARTKISKAPESMDAPTAPPAEVKIERVGREKQATLKMEMPEIRKVPEEILVSFRKLIGGYQVMPIYPTAARREGREGVVHLKILVMEDGRVGEVVITRSSHFLDLDHAAEEAVSQWSFQPALRDGSPVRQSALLPIRFALE